MSILRRHLRAWAMAWGLLQATSLAALAPRACCVTHAPAGGAEQGAEQAAEPCHEAPQPVAHCPMRGDGGEPCSMHAGDADGVAAHQDHDSHTPPASAGTSASDCVMRSACNGPTPFTLFSHTGPLPALTATAAPAPTRATQIPVPPIDTGVPSAAPDPHPPRA